MKGRVFGLGVQQPHATALVRGDVDMIDRMGIAVAPVLDQWIAIYATPGGSDLLLPVRMFVGIGKLVAWCRYEGNEREPVEFGGERGYKRHKGCAGPHCWVFRRVLQIRPVEADWLGKDESGDAWCCCPWLLSGDTVETVRKAHSEVETWKRESRESSRPARRSSKSKP